MFDTNRTLETNVRATLLAVVVLLASAADISSIAVAQSSRPY